MKRLSTFSILMLLLCAAWAQTPETVNGFAVGGGVDNTTGSVAIIGQPFSQYAQTANYSATLGVGQSQLSVKKVEAVINEGEAYTENGFNYPATTTAGTYEDSRYDKFGGQYNYDQLTTLKLMVLGAFTCGDPVKDFDNHIYQTVEVAGYCWTKENLVSEHYADGSDLTEAPMVYTSASFPSASDNLNTYGRLYTWYSAVKLPAGSTSAPSSVGGFVQGVCPNGWHIPTPTEKDALMAVSALDLRTHELWITPNDNNNSTNFTSLPAGLYNADLDRFEGLTTETDFWYDASDAGVVNGVIIVPALCYYCDAPLLLPQSTSNGLSVRCVRNY